MVKVDKVGKKGRKNAFDDDRFKRMTSESKFVYTLPKKEEKTVIDKRFVDALKQERFQNKAKVDKYGRVTKKKSAIAAEMEEMYMEEKSDEEEDELDLTQNDEASDAEESEDEENEDESDENEDDSEIEEEEDDGPIKIDLARGDAEILSSSDDDSEDDEWNNEENQKIASKWGEIDSEARRVEWSSRRIAICNLDWDNLCSEDLFILCKSFLPPGGSIQSLTIYLSDFGKEKLDEEQLNGPSITRQKNDDDSGEEDDQQKSVDIEAVRQYEIDRLKYYYAVLECDNADSATAVYEACDGIEFENSGLKIDMRFVPDEMEFEESNVKERVSGEEVNENKYKPKDFISKAASSSNAEIGWDESNPERMRKLQSAFDDGDEMDKIAKEYIADSDSEDEEEGKKDSRITALLEAAGIQREQPDLQVDWDAAEPSASEEEDEGDDDDKDVEKPPVEEESKNSDKDKKGTWDDYLERRKLKRKERRETAKQKRLEDKESREDEDGETQKKKKKKVKAPTDAEAERVASDDRFKALFTDSAFAIEQSTAKAKGSKLIEKQVEAKKANKAKVAETSKKEVDLVTKLKEKAAKMQKKEKKL